MMWLLDHNLPVQLLSLLRSLKIDCDTTRNRGWDQLQNGELVAVSFAAGFRCILTRDVKFGEAAGKALKSHPDVAVVLVRLPQRRGRTYLESFSQAWTLKPIAPAPGKVSVWPSTIEQALVGGSGGDES